MLNEYPNIKFEFVDMLNKIINRVYTGNNNHKDKKQLDVIVDKIFPDKDMSGGKKAKKTKTKKTKKTKTDRRQRQTEDKEDKDKEDKETKKTEKTKTDRRQRKEQKEVVMWINKNKKR